MSLADVKVNLIDSVDTASEMFRWLSTKQIIGFDTESTGLDKDNDHVRLIQVGDQRTGWSIPWERWGGVFEELVSKYEGEYVAHNLPFDWQMCAKEGIKIPKHRCHDTRPMIHVLESTGSLALKNYAKKNIDPAAAALQSQLDDALRAGGWTWATVPVTFGPYWQYGGLDPVLTMQAFDQLYPRVMAEAPQSYYLELAVAWSCEKMERRGTRVDRPYMQEMVDDLSAYIANVDQWCYANFNVENPGSDMQVSDALQAMGVDLIKRTTSGARYSVDKEVLGGLDNPLAGAVLGRRQATKVISTYLSTYLEMTEHNEYIHPSINTVGGTDKNPFEPGGGGKGVRTGRMSISNPNLQNVPIRTPMGKRIRNSFIPRPGHTWIKCDADQIEMRILAHLAKEPKMIEAFKSEGDFFVNLARDLFSEPDFIKADPRRQLVKNGCVPLDTEILTHRGWLKHDDVVVGDLTLGFDCTTRTTRWTPIQAIHHYDNSEVVRIGNAHRHFDTTLNHRWVAMDGRSNKLHWTTTEQFAGTEERIILAAPTDIGAETFTDTEIKVLAWLLTDGSIERGTFIGAPSQGRYGDRVLCNASIFQTKNNHITHIDSFLTDVPHKRYDHVNKPDINWKINPTWARSLLDRASINNKHHYDAWNVAFKMMPHQRVIMLDEMWKANAGCTGTVDDAQTELTIALTYLTGKFARVYTRDPDDTGWQRQTCATINRQKPYMTGQRATTTSLGQMPVWCVTTELGTWTMRQDRTPVLTGNSYAKIYGAGLEKFAKTAGAEIEEASAFMRDFDQRYSGIPTFVHSVERVARERLENEGESYVRSPMTGRKHVADRGREYALVNYLIQGMAGEILKMKIVEADSAGLDEFMLFPVHDEIDLDVPTEQVPEVLDTLRNVMNDDNLLSVPITWTPAVGDRWGDAKDL